MLIEHFDLILCEFVDQIVIMKTENSLVITVVYMNLQAFRLAAGVIPRRFNAVFCN